MKVKCRKLTAAEKDVSVSKAKPGAAPTKALLKNRNILQLLRERLHGKSLFTHNGRIKSEFKTLADEVAYTLIEEARNGNKSAITLIIQATEGDFLTTAALSKIIFDIFNIIERYVKDEDVLYNVGSNLYRLKHRYREYGVFTTRDDLLPFHHEDDATRERLRNLYASRTLV